MDYRGISLLLFAVILSVLPAAFARKCYICDSATNPVCNDGYRRDQFQYQDCSTGGFNQFSNQNPQFPQTGQTQFGGYGNMDICYKQTIVNGPPGPNGQPRVVRGCGMPSTMMGGQQMGPQTSDGCSWLNGVQTCTCDSNYCNGSSRFLPSISSSLFVAFAILLTSFLCQKAL